MYDEIAALYHLIYEDWDSSIEWQGNKLGELIESVWGTEVHAVVDVTCGIGTQSLALAQRGFRVTGSDLSAGAVRRAGVEAKLRGLEIDYSVCDVLAAAGHHGAEFDLAISCDNSLPHLLSDDKILLALRQMFDCLKPGGGCLVTMRDYENLERQKGELVPFGMRMHEGQRYAVVQTRKYAGDYYDVAMYFIAETDPPSVVAGRSRYYAVDPDRVLELMGDAGFCDVRRFDDAFFQPVLVGTRPA